MTRLSQSYDLYRGLNTRIAKQLGLSRSFVWRVVNGKRSSARVEAALQRELARIGDGAGKTRNGRKGQSNGNGRQKSSSRRHPRSGSRN